MMNCPACQQPLKEVALGDFKVDACLGGCAGLWFDNFELPQVKKPQGDAGEFLLDIQPPRPLEIDSARRLHCPRCQDIVLKKHYFSQQRRVEVDSCPGCGGVWLDHGELAAIREECAAQPDKTKAAEAYFQKMFREDWARIQKRPPSSPTINY